MFPGGEPVVGPTDLLNHNTLASGIPPEGLA